MKQNPQGIKQKKKRTVNIIEQAEGGGTCGYQAITKCAPKICQEQGNVYFGQLTCPLRNPVRDLGSQSDRSGQ